MQDIAVVPLLALLPIIENNTGSISIEMQFAILGSKLTTIFMHKTHFIHSFQLCLNCISKMIIIIFFILYLFYFL